MSKKSKRPAKFDARQIESGVLELEGNFIAAQIKTMRDYEAKANELAGVELRKAEDNRTTVEKRLADVHAKCKADGFKAFKAKYAPDFGRTRLYQILQIASGKKTLEQVREEERARKAKQRVAVRDNADVPDTVEVRTASGELLDPASLSPAAREQLAKAVGKTNPPLAGSASTEISDDEAKARMAALAGEAPPILEPSRFGCVNSSPKSKEETIADALALLGPTPWEQFKAVCEHTFRLMNVPTREQVRKYVSAETCKLDHKDRERMAAAA